MMENYNILLPGRIVEYFPDTQLATVLICNDRTYYTSTEDSLQIENGLLEDIPVFTPGGGNWHLTFPIKPGDSCILSFSQVGYDHWLFEDKDSAGKRANGTPMPWTKRRFSLADGFAQVGWNTIPRAIANYSTTHSQWRNEDKSQIISLNDDLSITIDSPTEINITAPTININAATKVSIDSPETEISGHLTVGAGVDVTGTTASTVNVTGGGISLSTHIHPPGTDGPG